MIPACPRTDDDLDPGEVAWQDHLAAFRRRMAEAEAEAQLDAETDDEDDGEGLL